MPLPNRVTPFGEIVADPARGALMGNRGGRIHDLATKTLTNRRWASKQWIACKLEFKDRRREVMGAGYTALFFLDEATALAAGHRPCFECRRADAKRFAACWASAKGLDARPRAGEMDAVLHRERLAAQKSRLHEEDCAGLPEGAMIAIQTHAWLITDHGMRLWASDGYGPLVPKPRGSVNVLTPPATVAALCAGYKPASSI